MVSDQQVIEKINECFPTYKKIRKEYIELFGENSGIFGEMSAFSHFIIDSLIKENVKKADLKKLFEFIEQVMNEGSDTSKDAIATCLLENLINAVAWKKIPSSMFVTLLGKESKKFCRAWDEFTGVKTEGLWNDNK